MTLERPDIKRNGDDLYLMWPDAQLEAQVSYLRQERGNVLGELTIRTSTNGNGPATHLHRANFNFTAASNRQQLSRTLGERKQDIDWYALLEQVCFNTLEELRRPQPIVDPRYEIPSETVYLVDRLIPKDGTTLIYADGGTGKSLLALGIALHIATGRAFFGMEVIQTPVLYLDFERTSSIFVRRYFKLVEGLEFHAEMPHVIYRRCYRPFYEEVAELRSVVEAGRYGLCPAPIKVTTL